MKSFTYCVSTKVIFGKGAESQAGAAVREAGGSRVLVLFGGGSAVRGGLLARVTASLGEAGLVVFGKGGIQANPVLSFVEETLEEYGGKQIDFLLAVGGGSVLDTAKALAFGFARPEIPVWDYFRGKEKPTAAVQTGAVLTIAAAGSETSDSAVLTNETTREKRGVNTELNRPAFAIMNPELTYTLPPFQTACGIADILMHTLDRYFSDLDGNGLTDAIAEGLMRTVLWNGVEVMKNPESYDARSELMWCGSLSHNGLTGLGRTRDFSAHQLGHELSGRYGMTHGESLAVMWPAWAKAVWTRDPARFARLGRSLLGVEEADDQRAAVAGIASLEAYFQSLGLAVTLGQSKVGVVSGEELEALALGCSRGKSRSIGCFRPLNHEEILEVYHMANR